MSESDTNALVEPLLQLSGFMNSRILGQERLVSRMLVALLSDGHILVEGPPGLAKTRAVKTLASGIEGDFQRIQFTPDLLPADLTGTDVYRPQDASFSFQQGPLFHHVIIADEINRAPAKVQSALLEAMEERQITVGKTTYPLPALYFVMATQNPIEQEGTYPLPEAQLDRFLLKVIIDYPPVEAEVRIMQRVRREAQQLDEAPRNTRTLCRRAGRALHGAAGRRDPQPAALRYGTCRLDPAPMLRSESLPAGVHISLPQTRTKMCVVAGERVPSTPRFSALFPRGSP